MEVFWLSYLVAGVIMSGLVLKSSKIIGRRQVISLVLTCTPIVNVILATIVTIIVTMLMLNVISYEDLDRIHRK